MSSLGDNRPLETSMSEHLIYLILYALKNLDLQYTQKALEFIRKLGVRGYVVVSRHDDKVIPICGLACSLGFGGFGIIFINSNFVCGTVYPEELKDFILAHELAHITRNHAISGILLDFILKTSMNALKESFESLRRSRDLADLFGSLIALVTTSLTTFKLAVEVEPTIIKQQELEADSLAIDLCGCKGAKMFAKILKALKLHGYSVSHESTLGFPALTIDERLEFIYAKCKDPS